MNLKYFAYGSNMNPKRMEARGVSFQNRRKAILQGYRLSFNKIAQRNPKIEGFANIVEDTNEYVEGVLYNVSYDGILQLDVYEGFPNNYQRIQIEVTTHSIIEEAILYIAHPTKIQEGLKPHQEYLDHLLAGKDLLSAEYYQRLSRWKTIQSEQRES